MSTLTTLDYRLFHKYSNDDAFTKSFAKFLFFVSFFFFILMSILFIIYTKKIGLLHSFFSTGT
ncbi:MAG: hypothetical protein CVV49_16535, partial [Spirochaetae bacterium HGW-Spirochaetae-5]